MKDINYGLLCDKCEYIRCRFSGNIIEVEIEMNSNVVQVKLLITDVVLNGKDICFLLEIMNYHRDFRMWNLPTKSFHREIEYNHAYTTRAGKASFPIGKERTYLKKILPPFMEQFTTKYGPYMGEMSLMVQVVMSEKIVLSLSQHRKLLGGLFD